MLKKWPTPTVSDSTGPQRPASKQGGQSLREAVAWPTPRASDYKGVGPQGSSSQQHQLKRGQLQAVAVENSAEPGQSMVLNPRFVEYLMGFPQHWTDIEHPTGEVIDWGGQHPLPAVSKDVLAEPQHRAQQLRCLGNSIVPQIAQLIFEKIFQR